ncbi:MAG: putative Type IV pilus pilin [Parcubacteria bacterium C7867-004]|nr:MAG: putative Type IV pilus pilin [Parcubacteria bacterium C7867-004]
MIVVLIIITTITSIVLLGQNTFNRSLVLTDTAYTLAFSIREAQSRGLSSKLFGSIQNVGYGIHLTSATPKSYIVFADISPSSPSTLGGLCPNHTVSSGPEAKRGNCVYTDSGEVLKTYTLEKGFNISNFCGLEPSNVNRCSGYLSALDVSFTRPNTQATIIGITSGSSYIELTTAAITLTSPDGTSHRCIAVSKVGVVSVATGACP